MKIERKALLKYDHKYINKIGYNKNISVTCYCGCIPGHIPPVYWLTVITPDIYYDIYKKLITLKED